MVHHSIRECISQGMDVRTLLCSPLLSYDATQEASTKYVSPDHIDLLILTFRQIKALPGGTLTTAAGGLSICRYIINTVLVVHYGTP